MTSDRARASFSPRPLSVVRIDADTCRIVVEDREEVPDTELVAGDATWLEPMGDKPFECLVQCRAQRGPAPRVRPMQEVG